MARFTPDVKPKSSAFTISRRIAASLAGRSEPQLSSSRFCHHLFGVIVRRAKALRATLRRFQLAMGFAGLALRAGWAFPPASSELLFVVRSLSLASPGFRMTSHKIDDIAQNS